MTPNFKNPLTVLSVLCWFVIACLAVAVMLNTRTIENLDTAQNRAQADRDLLKRDIAETREQTAQAASALAQKAIVMEQTQVAEAQDLRDSVTQLRDEVSTLKRTIDDNRVAAERASAALHSQLNRQKPVTFASARSMPATGGMHIDGNGGRDVMNGWSNLLHLDGSRLTSLEIFNLADGRRNEVRVMAPGLNDLEEDFMELRLDPALDSVVLDRCLSWSKATSPLSEDERKKFEVAIDADIWTATDAEGKTRRVAITGGADVKIADACDNDYPAQVAARDAREKETPKPPQPRKQAAQPYKPDVPAIAKQYENWAKELPDAGMRRSLLLFAAAVRDGKLPPEFMSGFHGLYALRQLSFSPVESTQQKIDENFDCAASRRSAGASTLLLTGDGVNAACDDGSHVFALGNKDDTVKMTGGGQNIFIPGKGNDKIDTGRGSSIVILDKKWGSKVITNSCVVPGAKYADSIFRINWQPRVFGGIGARLSQNGARILVNSLVPGSPAEKSGIRAGDYLVSIDDRQMPADMEAAIALIRGPAGTSAKIGIDRAGEHRTIIVKREIVNAAATPETGAAMPIRIDYQWPYEFEDFILFGPGIRQADMVEDERGKWRNTKTGDRLEISPCFNFVFSE